MKFTEHRDSNINTIKHYQPGSVKVNADTYHRSLFLNQREIYTDWNGRSIESLTTEQLDPILRLQPELIILGTGDTQVFPEPALFAHCVKQGIGLEVMANDAACRTYNILTTEDREVVLALIMASV